jgi:hypothetical protein
MQQILIWIFLSGILLFIFLVLIIQGLRKRNRKKIGIAFVFLFLTIVCGCWTGYIIVKKLYNKATDIVEVLGPRSGLEIYTALFGDPVNECVEVVNRMDQMVPRLDCCIWLEFRTCPAEMKRIIDKGTFSQKETPLVDSTLDIPPFQSAPYWWKPSSLGEGLVKLTDQTPDNPNRALILLFSKDSTHAFYCDMAE